MRSVVIWNDAPELEEDGSRQTIWDMAFTPGASARVAKGVGVLGARLARVATNALGAV